MSRLTIVSVAYPLARVGEGSAGGAEQVLARMDEALVASGDRSIVVACEGSTVRGELVATPLPRGGDLERARPAAHARVREAVDAVLRRTRVDLVHLHGIGFTECLPAANVPTLVTLHLPPSWYPPEAFTLRRPRTYLVCVSASQRAACPDSPNVVGVVPNGVPLEPLGAWPKKRSFALALGRICPEKGFHHALDAARRAEMPLVLAGEVFAYAAHERYFHEAIAPRLDRLRRFVGPVGGARKRRLLRAAQCLVVPSLAPETSSLVAMEALACGTPVVALRAGALPEIVTHGETGFVVDSPDELPDAMRAAAELDPAACRRAAEARFSAQAMTGAYRALYASLAARAAPARGEAPTETRDA